MRYLLDTCAFIDMVFTTERLSSRAGVAIEGDNALFISNDGTPPQRRGSGDGWMYFYCIFCATVKCTLVASAIRQMSARPVRRNEYHSHMGVPSSVLSQAKPPTS